MNLQELEDFIKEKGRANTADVMERFNIGYQHAWRSLKSLGKYPNLKVTPVIEQRNKRSIIIYYYEIES